MSAVKYTRQGVRDLGNSKSKRDCDHIMEVVPAEGSGRNRTAEYLKCVRCGFEETETED